MAREELTWLLSCLLKRGQSGVATIWPSWKAGCLL